MPPMMAIKATKRTAATIAHSMSGRQRRRGEQKAH